MFAPSLPPLSPSCNRVRAPGCPCVCLWGACSCNTHCRAACNYHGTICGPTGPVDVPSNSSMERATIKSVITMGTCTCDEGYVRFPSVACCTSFLRCVEEGHRCLQSHMAECRGCSPPPGLFTLLGPVSPCMHGAVAEYVACAHSLDARGCSARPQPDPFLCPLLCPYLYPSLSRCS
jgi:hypothetical protein